MADRAALKDDRIASPGPILDHPDSGLITLRPITEKPFILGAPAAISVWAAALRLSRSLYS
jgi:hypothetical protein